MKRLARAALVLAMAWTAAGCGSTVDHDDAVRYTPESLAQELAFRYRDLSSSAKKATKNRKEASSKVQAALQREAVTKGRSKGVTKQAEAETADDVLDEIAGKARTIRGVPQAEVLHKMSEVIARDASLDENDRQALAKKLDEMAQAER